MVQPRVLFLLVDQMRPDALQQARTPNLRRDREELDNLTGVAGYRVVEADLVEKLLSRLIRMTHVTQEKERQRLQRVRI